MISGTEFRFEESWMVPRAALACRHRIVTVDEIAEIKAKCDSEEAFCLSCADGVVVIALQAFGHDLELFVWIAIGFRPGAFERQESALRTIARDLGAKTIAFQTRRPGWARRLGPAWKRRGTTEFVRQVDGW